MDLQPWLLLAVFRRVTEKKPRIAKTDRNDAIKHGPGREQEITLPFLVLALGDEMEAKAGLQPRVSRQSSLQ